MKEIFEMSPTQNNYIALPSPTRPKNAWWNIGFSPTLSPLLHLQPPPSHPNLLPHFLDIAFHLDILSA